MSGFDLPLTSERHRCPKVLLAPNPRRLSDIFTPHDYQRLTECAELLWNRDERPSAEEWRSLLSEADVVASADLRLSAADIDNAPHLKAIFDLVGNPPRDLDYERCFQRGIRVSTCSPAFAKDVAEMAVAMALGGLRGLVREHLDIRNGCETWQNLGPFDCSLHGQTVGLIGFGAIAHQVVRHLIPFGCRFVVHDPWLPSSRITEEGCIPSTLEDVMTEARVVFVLAQRTADNRHMINAEKLALMPLGAMLVLVARSHLVDMAALEASLRAGRIQAAVDVFDVEPLPRENSLRTAPNLILSSHRAGSIASSRLKIGSMLADDIELFARNLPPCRMLAIQPETARLVTEF